MNTTNMIPTMKAKTNQGKEKAQEKRLTEIIPSEKMKSFSEKQERALTTKETITSSSNVGCRGISGQREDEKKEMKDRKRKSRERERKKHTRNMK